MNAKRMMLPAIPRFGMILLFTINFFFLPLYDIGYSLPPVGSKMPINKKKKPMNSTTFSNEFPHTLQKKNIYVWDAINSSYDV